MQPQEQCFRQPGGDARTANFAHWAGIRAAEPDTDHVVVRPGDGPGIAIALRRAGLEGDGKRELGRAVAREARQPRQRVGEKQGHLPRHVGRQQAARGCRRLTVVPHQRTQHTLVGENAIGAQQTIQAGRQRADRHRQPEILRRPVKPVQPEVAEEFEAGVEPDLAQQIGGRDIARIGKSLARQERPEEVAIGVADPGRALRQVLHDVGRGQPAASEGEGEDERL